MGNIALSILIALGIAGLGFILFTLISSWASWLKRKRQASKELEDLVAPEPEQKTYRDKMSVTDEQVMGRGSRLSDVMKGTDYKDWYYWMLSRGYNEGLVTAFAEHFHPMLTKEANEKNFAELNKEHRHFKQKIQN